ncbi:DUF2809 domain-containing protein [Flaviaesturariibacter amylovorans]|uniref:DUF2809 domain-containing protein n=1 Tax=Flaviaesturariibacter amylovorans TaxID=1084520 RepID=A0ABP8G987_9BACT
MPRRPYRIAFLVLLVTEVLIALFVRDRIIRPYVGDFLVMPLVYCAVQSVRRVPVGPAVTGVLLFCYLVEGLQYLHIVERLGLRGSDFFTTLIGRSFEVIDLLMYTLGAAAVLWIERRRIPAAGTRKV